MRLRHGHARGHGATPEYKAYSLAHDRCTNPNFKQFADYGGRGIKFLFDSFEQFYAELGPKPKGHVLDRKNNDGDYLPGNVQWVTRKQSNINRRHRKNAKSNYKYVHSYGSKWQAAVPTASGKRVHLGTFPTQLLAQQAVQSFKSSEVTQ